ncbi:hypothetical protein ACFV8T_00420 [Streptomyces sp. NPDC059832]|uniref:hypothetical protein n=1 Tax=Streptomyces sp. NPDC059832 TaxID=3346966 RepID=UPI0036492BFD
MRKAAGPVMARKFGEMLGVDVSMRGKLEPLHGKPNSAPNPLVSPTLLRAFPTLLRAQLVLTNLEVNR